MGLKMKRTHVVLDERLVKDIDRLVGARRRSHFLTQAAEEKLIRIRQLKALEEISSWNDKDHPELRRGAAEWVKKLRHESERRFQKITGR